MKQALAAIRMRFGLVCHWSRHAVQSGVARSRPFKNGGTLEKAQYMAGHESSRTTGLYDRRKEEITLDDVTGSRSECNRFECRRAAHTQGLANVASYAPGRQRRRCGHHVPVNHFAETHYLDNLPVTPAYKLTVVRAGGPVA